MKRSPNGSPAKFPWVNDTASSLQLIATEGTQLSEGPDPVFGSETITNTDAFNGGLIRVSDQLLNDNAFDFGQLVSTLALGRVNRGLERVLTLALDQSSNATPNNVGLLPVSPVAVTTSTLANGIEWTDLVNVHDAIDPAYLPFAVWQMNSKTKTYLLGQEDGFGRPLFSFDTVLGLETLLGRPVIINQSLPNAVTSGSPVANSTPILFGSLQHALGVKTTDVAVRRLDERFAELNETGFLIYTRVASVSLIPSAVQKLKLAAS